MTEPLPPPSPSKYLRAETTPVSREFYRRLAEDGQVATTQCQRCARIAFPPRPYCPRCGTEQTWVELPGRGQLYAFTTQETAVRLGAPIVLALAQLGPATVPGIVRAPYEQLRIGQEVMVRTFSEPDIGLTLVEFSPADR